MNLSGAGLIKEFRRLSHLGASDDRVIDEKKLLAIDQIVDRNELHVGDEVTLRLHRRHEGTRPSRGVFDEWP